MPIPGLQALSTLFERVPVGRRFVRSPERLGLMQRWYAAQPTQRVVIAVLERQASAEPFEHATVERALRALCARHAYALGRCERRSQEQLSLVPLTAADPLPWFDHASTEPWSLASALTHCRFEPGAPLFRCALSHDRRYILCAFDHMIADGVSVAVFATELARLLADLPLSAAPDADHAAWPLDARLDVRPAVRQLARAAAASLPSLKPFSLTPRALLLTPTPRGASSPRPTRTGILPWQLDRDQVAALLAYARAQQITLHSVLAAAGLPAVLDALGLASSHMRLHTPVSLRERCDPQPTGLGVFISSIDIDIDVTHDGDAKQLAQHCAHELRKSRTHVERKVGLLAHAGELSQVVQRQEAQPSGRTATLEISNVGRVDDLPAGTALWLTQGAHYHSPLLVLTLATADSDGALRCCLSFPEPLISATVAQRFIAAFERRLRAFAAAHTSSRCPALDSR